VDKETARIEAFSDGVFAIAITLLVLQLKVPQESDVKEIPLVTQLLSQWPAYVSFVISFAFIGIMWINHHRLFNHIYRSDNNLMILNLLLLMGVTAVPFPTAVLAEHLGHFDDRDAAMFYNGVYVVIALMFNALWRYAAHKGRLLGHDANMRIAAAISRQYALGPFLYLACFALAWISVAASLALNIAIAVMFAVPLRVRRVEA
jgi:uncharacterized membrane protein